MQELSCEDGGAQAVSYVRINVDKGRGGEETSGVGR